MIYQLTSQKQTNYKLKKMNKMKKQLLKIVLMAIGFLAIIPKTYSQDVGATFCWNYKEIYGGHDYMYNQSIAKKGLPDDNTHHSATT